MAFYTPESSAIRLNVPFASAISTRKIRPSVDKDKRLVVGAGIITRDHQERVPALIAALDRIRSAMVNCGSATIPELQNRARITRASMVSIRERSAHDILLKENEMIIPST